MVGKAFLWLAKYEYGIYIWHLLILSKIIANFAWFQNSMGIGDLRLTGVLYIPVAIGFGAVLSKGLERVKGK